MMWKNHVEVMSGPDKAELHGPSDTLSAPMQSPENSERDSQSETEEMETSDNTNYNTQNATQDPVTSQPRPSSPEY